MSAESVTVAELYNASLEHFTRGNLDEAVSFLRAGFFENLYIPPTLLGEPFERQPIWYASVDAEPVGAEQYAKRYGALWEQRGGALRFLKDVWSDSLVRSEIRNFINLSKAALQNREEGRRLDLLRERDRFTDMRRIRRTQSEIIARLRVDEYDAPLGRPRLGLVMLASRDPIASVDFYRQLFETEPVKSSRLAGGFAEFELPGVHLAIHGYDRLGRGDPYGLGQPPQSFGWGAIFIICVRELDRYLNNALRAGFPIVDRELQVPGQRFFVIKDPSGYLIEVTEEIDPRGF